MSGGLRTSKTHETWLGERAPATGCFPIVSEQGLQAATGVSVGVVGSKLQLGMGGVVSCGVVC